MNMITEITKEQKEPAEPISSPVHEMLSRKKLGDLVMVHYGSKKFNVKRFNKIENSWKKPNGGLWASPVKSEFGWKTFWSNGFSFGKNFNIKFFFKFKENSKVIVIDSITALNQLPFIEKDKFGDFNIIDFEKLQASADAILLTENGHWKTRYGKPNLYCWDCECVLILNPNSILQLTGKDHELENEKLLTLQRKQSEE